MITIEIDISDIEQEFDLMLDQSEALVQKIVNDLSMVIHYEWSQNAQRFLKQTRNEYVQNLRIVEEGPLRNAIVLTGTLPNMIENGAEPFDMKEGFMKSSKVRYNEDGSRYLIIPFRHGASSSLGENSSFSGVLPADVHAIAKNKGRVSITDLLSTDAANGTNHSARRTRQEVKNNKTGEVFQQYTHKSSIYAGVRKNTSRSGNSYVSFRKVSENSDPYSWIHTGIEARKFADKTVDNLDISTLVENIADSFLVV